MANRVSLPSDIENITSALMLLVVNFIIFFLNFQTCFNRKDIYCLKLRGMAFYILGTEKIEKLHNLYLWDFL